MDAPLKRIGDTFHEAARKQPIRADKLKRPNIKSTKEACQNGTEEERQEKITSKHRRNIGNVLKKRIKEEMNKK